MPANPRNRALSVLNFSALAYSTLVLLTCTALGGCGSYGGASAINPVNWLTPYRVDVVQGNFVSKEQTDALRAGMTRAQVKDVLGTPLLASVFHADRWDYVFTLKRQGTAPQSFKYAVYFKGDALERFEGDTMPTNAEFISTLDSGRKLGKTPVLEATEAQIKASERPSTTAQTAAANPSNPSASPLPTVYPPLESPAR